MGQEIPASKEGSEKSAGERDSQMRQSGEGGQRYVEAGAPGTEAAAPVAQEMTSRLTKARVMDVVVPSSPGAGVLSMLVRADNRNRQDRKSVV